MAGTDEGVDEVVEVAAVDAAADLQDVVVQPQEY